MWVWLQIWASTSGRYQPFSAPMVMETPGHLGRHHRVLHPKEALAALPVRSSMVPPMWLVPPCRLNQEGTPPPLHPALSGLWWLQEVSSRHGAPRWMQPHQYSPVHGRSPGLSHGVRVSCSQQDLYKQHHVFFCCLTHPGGTHNDHKGHATHHAVGHSCSFDELPYPAALGMKEPLCGICDWIEPPWNAVGTGGSHGYCRTAPVFTYKPSALITSRYLQNPAFASVGELLDLYLRQIACT